MARLLLLSNGHGEDLSGALLGRSLSEQGHDVRFSEKNGNFIFINGDREQKLELRHVGGTYELDVWVRPSQPFGRQR